MRYGPIKHRDLIDGMRACGFEGPMRPRKNADHGWMVKGELRVKVPNAHGKDIDINLLSDILKQAHISRDDWARA